MKMLINELQEIVYEFGQELGVEVSFDDCGVTAVESMNFHDHSEIAREMAQNIWCDVINITVDGEFVGLRIIGEHDEWVVVQRRPYAADTPDTRLLLWEMIQNSEGGFTTSQLICAVIAAYA